MKSSEMALNIATIMDEVERSTKAITGMIGEIEFMQIRRGCSHSMPRSKPLERESMVADSPSWRMRSRNWQTGLAKPPAAH